MSLSSRLPAAALVLGTLFAPVLACSSSTEEGADGGPDAAPTATATATATQQPEPPDSGPVEPTLSSLQTSIFSRTCANGRCHSGARPSAGLSLEAGKTHGQLVGVASTAAAGQTRVVAGNAADSLLVKLLKGPSNGVARMPVGGSLSASDIAAVEAWVAAGAKND